MKMNKTSSSHIKARTAFEKALDEKNAAPEPVAGEPKHVTARRPKAEKKVAQTHCQVLNLELPLCANKYKKGTKI